MGNPNSAQDFCKFPGACILLVASPSDFLYLLKTESHQHLNFHIYSSTRGPEQDSALLVQLSQDEAVLQNKLYRRFRDNTGDLNRFICNVLFLMLGVGEEVFVTFLFIPFHI